jgi:FkbM family methyltransferase
MLLEILKFWRHLKYHRYILKHLRWTNTDQLRLEFYREFISPGDLVFDVGANMGNRSKVFRKLEARVVAFEPQSYCAEFLAAAFAGDGDFTLERMGLSDREGDAKLFIGETHTLSSIDTQWISSMNLSGRFANHHWHNSETIHLTTLDSAIHKHGIPSFVKIDVEGHELSVISGLSTPVKTISLEFASESLQHTLQCIRHLEETGAYRYNLSRGESMVLEFANWQDAASISQHLIEETRRDPLIWGDVYASLQTAEQ